MLKTSFTKNMKNTDDGREKDFNKMIHHVKLIMWNKVGIIRNEKDLQRDDLSSLRHIVFSSSDKGQLQIRLRGTEAENPPSWFDQELSE
jgi:aspartate oxidase